MTTFLTSFSGKKVRLNRGSNSQPPGHESDMLTTEPPGWAAQLQYEINVSANFQYKSRKTVKGVSDTKLLVFGAKRDTRTHRWTRGQTG